MFNLLRKSFGTGIVTTSYPDTPAEVSNKARGKPEIDWAKLKDARPAAAICPTGAISYRDDAGLRVARLDLGLCIFCGLCAEVDKAIRMTNDCECAARRRDDLISGAGYQLLPDGTHGAVVPIASLPEARRTELSNPLPLPRGEGELSGQCTSSPMQLPAAGPGVHSLESLGDQVKARTHRIFGRSLHIRQVDAGSCNGCEIEIAALNSPVYDIERFGIHFVASPRHADMLLVTGPVTRNMELALRKTYDATPEPRLVVAVGACGCSGGIFGRNYATCGGVDSVIPVDVYIPGCPPNPHALLQGILLAMNRWKATPSPLSRHSVLAAADNG